MFILLFYLNKNKDGHRPKSILINKNLTKTVLLLYCNYTLNRYCEIFTEFSNYMKNNFKIVFDTLPGIDSQKTIKQF